MSSEQDGVGTDQPDVRAEDALQVAQRALRKVNELEGELADLREENDQLRERVIELELRQESSEDYARLDRDTKVGMVRGHLIDRARAQHGKAAIDYDDVMWEVFDGEPSADHCYTLMQLAAQADGFDVRERSGENRQLVVNLDATKDLTAFSHANKDRERGESL